MNSILYIVMLAATINVGQRVVHARPKLARLPRIAPALIAIVAIPSLLQFVMPALYTWLSRNPAEITQHYQLWRLLTSVVVQDGGFYGTWFNLVVLILVAPLGARIWGNWRTLLIFVIGALALNTMGILYNIAGGGNSGATFALAASFSGLYLASGRSRGLKALSGITLLCGVILVLLHDVHGMAIVAGVVSGYGIKKYAD